MIMDIYVFLTKYPSLDFDYISRELDKMELGAFKESSRSAGCCTFSPNKMLLRIKQELIFISLVTAATTRIIIAKTIIRKALLSSLEGVVIFS
jgi:hypothetical protein